MRLVDADAAADKIMRETENHADDLNMIGIALMIGIAKMLRDENDFPTIEAEPVRHGRWIPHAAYEEYSIAYCDYACSECGHEITKRVLCVPPRCEYCGAKMDGGE